MWHTPPNYDLFTGGKRAPQNGGEQGIKMTSCSPLLSSLAHPLTLKVETAKTTTSSAE